MRCSYCTEEARFKCGCQKPYMCGNHLPDHLDIKRTTSGEHEFEPLIIQGQSKLQELRSSIFKRIQQINDAEKLMLSKTQTLIKIIGDLQKGALGRLNSSREECLEVLTRDKFCISELPKIGKIETVEIDSKFMEVDTILADTEIIFGVKFTIIMEKRIVSEI